MSGTNNLPVRLRDVRVYISRFWPGSGATGEQWRAYHQRDADAYRHARDHDQRHWHEANYLAEVEQAKADKYGNDTPS
ncbi:MAG: AMED_5909 family protein [Sciscionella sp.]